MEEGTPLPVKYMLPKLYCAQGRPFLLHTLTRLAACDSLAGILVRQSGQLSRILEKKKIHLK